MNASYIAIVVACFTAVRIWLLGDAELWAKRVSQVLGGLIVILVVNFLLVQPFCLQVFFLWSKSMEPTLLKDERILVDKLSYRLRAPRRGEIIVFEPPPEAKRTLEAVPYVKRVVGVSGDIIEIKSAHLHIGDRDYRSQDHELTPLHMFLRQRLHLHIGDAILLLPDSALVAKHRRVSKREIADAIGQPGNPILIYPGQLLVNGKVQSEVFLNEDPDYDLPPTRVGAGELFVLGDNRNRSWDGHCWSALECKRVIGRVAVRMWPLSRAGYVN